MQEGWEDRVEKRRDLGRTGSPGKGSRDDVRKGKQGQKAEGKARKGSPWGVRVKRAMGGPGGSRERKTPPDSSLQVPTLVIRG